jgi:hypothetical protein
VNAVERRLVADMADDLMWAASQWRERRDWRAAAVAESFGWLMNRLGGLDGIPAGLVADAAGVFFEASARADRREQQDRERRDAALAERRRAHQAAIVAACPACGAGPGAECRTAGGNRLPMDDHAGRRRAAAAKALEA